MQMLFRRTFYGLERQAILIDDSHFLIGRSMDCQLRPFSPLVSQHHCEIELKEDIATVRDLWSRHGTYVNGRRVTSPVVLNAGDSVQIGKTIMEVK